MDFYLYFIILLFVLGAIDLVVGVSNDAVNFLNSAIGSKVASYRTILLIASIGILLGSVFSEGMMEVAKNGIFQPKYFTFEQVMYLFLAVMLTDIILLDFYNTLGLPTSTTVSLVFELLGSAFAIALMIILTSGSNAVPVSKFINYDSAIVIVGGIFLSVFVSFIVGSLVQYFARILFSFRINKSVKRWGPVFAGIATTTIVYFLIIKGAKGSAIITAEQTAWIEQHTYELLGGCLVGFTILIWILMQSFKLHPLKMVVLLGTFALAMAFAGNDLVNFIGVSVAAFTSFKVYIASNLPADALMMDALNSAVKTPLLILIVGGLIMVITLWTNAKSKKVTETEVSLGHQDDIDEKFTPTNFSRWLVGGFIFLGDALSTVTPQTLQKSIAKRFVRKKAKSSHNKPSFDLVRASINLVVSSALIAYGTSHKLPLSTTFVTFMVAMGSSFADQAWGRESAVYRVAGVLRVIGGWLLTALLAFGGSAIVGVILFTTGVWGVVGLACFAFFLLIKSHIQFKRNEEKAKTATPVFKYSADSNEWIKEHRKEMIVSFQNVEDILKTCIQSLHNSEVKQLKKIKNKLNEMIEQNSKLNDRLIKYIRNLDGASSSVAKNYVLIFDRMQNIHQSCLLVSEVCVRHVSNHHQLPDKAYHDALNQLRREFNNFVRAVIVMFQSPERVNLYAMKGQRAELKDRIEKILEEQIYLLKKGKIGNRLGLLQVRIVLEIHDIIREMEEIANMFFVSDIKAGERKIDRLNLDS